MALMPFNRPFPSCLCPHRLTALSVPLLPRPQVCVLLFFRHGITPTANKLYQLVRKGSMSAPADAVLTAKTEAEAALAKAQSATELLERIRQNLAATDVARQQLEQDLAREQGLRSALERQLGDGALQRQELQRALDESRQAFERQMEEQRTAGRTAEERHQADLRRALLDVDRERSAATKVQKEVDQARRSSAEQADQHRTQVAALQLELGQLRQRLSAAEAALSEARGAGDALRAQLGKRLEGPPRRATVARK
jgi:chromosome segregation ATPase